MGAVGDLAGDSGMKYAAPVERHGKGRWLGGLPERWSVKRLKYVSSINDEALPETTDPEYEFLYVDIGSVDATEGIQKKEPMVFETAPSRARRIVRDGDTILSTVRTYLRAVASIEQPEDNLIVSTGFAVVRPRSVAPKFLGYCLRSSYFIETVVSRSVGVSYPATNPTDVSCIEVPLPPLAEQQAIARFLDAQTARIDTLVAKKRELIAKLKEKRSALIARTVTCGLPPAAARAAGLEPNPQMKDSGVEWFREVPVHWTVKQLKWAVMFQRGHDLPSEQREEGNVPLVTSAGISATHNVAVAKAPGIVTGRYGTIGQFHLIHEDYWPLNTTLYSIDLHGNNPAFLRYMLEHLSPLVILHSVKSAVPGVD
ncbi:MAG: restriction endonuclease subunit S, partial [Gammaproteobacteria bacterium]|nr:restriction endonuclease subunit S [Gammaproteobacteria bacterium]